MSETHCDVTIIGAGPAGTTAAALLQRAGLRTVIAEQLQFPRFIIGESLLPRCLDLLEECGMLDKVRDRGYLVKNGAVFLKNNQRCTFNFSDQFTAGQTYTYQVPRDDFDLLLAECAAEQGVDIRWQNKVCDVSFDDSGVTTTTRDADNATHTLRSKFIFDASGYGRVLAGLLDLDRPSDLPVRHAVFTHVTGDIRPPGNEEGNIWISILPEENSWLWIIPFSNGKTSIGLVARPGFIDSLPGDTMDDKLKNSLRLEENAARRLGRAEFCFPAKVIPGYSSAVSSFTGKGFALLGNASEFLDPVFSSGVTLALESANRAAKLLIRSFNGETVDWEQEYALPMSRGIAVFKTYVNAWYDDKLPRIFFADNPADNLKQQICSVLAGYVWDENNPCAQQHERAVDNLAAVCSLTSR
jgi:flavin-dependent dehydrogenase